MVLRWFAVLMILAVFVCPCVSQAQNPPAKPVPVMDVIPADRMDAKMAAAICRQLDELDISYKDNQLRNEVVLAEEKINLTDALHNLIVTDWMALKAYSNSPADNQRRNEFTQTLSSALNAYNQSSNQASNNGNSGLGQQWSTFNQSRQSALQTSNQSISEVVQIFNQQMSSFEGKPKSPSITTCIKDLTPAVPQDREQVELAYNKQVNQARSEYQAAVDQATARWKASLEKTSASWDSSAPASNALRQANRDWLVSAIDALDNLRNSFKSAVTKYRLQCLE